MHRRRRASPTPDNDLVRDDGPAAWLGFLLNTLGDRLRTRTYDALKPWGLAARDLGALECIAAFGPISQIELGRTIRMDRTTVVQLVDRLEQAGWMVRLPDSGDRRVHLLKLTDEGLVRLAQVRKLAWQAEQELTDALSAAEVAELKALLQRLL